MDDWFYKISRNLSLLPDAIDYYENELVEALTEVKLIGNLERQASKLPGQTAFRFNQLQDIEAILEHLNILARKTRSKAIKKYVENYQRSMTTREAERWIDGDDEVVELATLINSVALIRNKYLGILKGLETKQWQIGHITKLKVAGMEDFEVGGQ